jgi:hypothetical protein
MDSSVSPKDEIWFLCVCLHVSNAVYLHLQGTKVGTEAEYSSKYWNLSTKVPLWRQYSYSHRLEKLRYKEVRQWFRCDSGFGSSEQLRKYHLLRALCTLRDENSEISIWQFLVSRHLLTAQLLFQLNALVFIKSTRYYNLYFLFLYS